MLYRALCIKRLLRIKIKAKEDEIINRLNLSASQMYSWETLSLFLLSKSVFFLTLVYERSQFVATTRRKTVYIAIQIYTNHPFHTSLRCSRKIKKKMLQVGIITMTISSIDEHNEKNCFCFYLKAFFSLFKNVKM